MCALQLWLFCRSFIESVLFFCIVAWFRNLNLANKNRLGWLVKVASKVIGVSQLRLSDLQVLRKARATVLITPCRGSMSSYLQAVHIDFLLRGLKDIKSLLFAQPLVAWIYTCDLCTLCIQHLDFFFFFILKWSRICTVCPCDLSRLLHYVIIFFMMNVCFIRLAATLLG